MLNFTPLVRGYANYRTGALRKQAPLENQERILRSLVSRGAATKFGRDHGFAAIRTTADYRSAVPLRRYEEHWREYWEKAFPHLIDLTWPGKIPFFAVSSGTTSGITKFIPYTKEMIRSNAKAGFSLLASHFRSKPKSRLFQSKSFILGGSIDLVDHGKGVRSGDLSGIAAQTLPPFLRPFSFPPPEIAKLSDWEVKMDLLVRESVKEDLRLIAGVPSWVLIYLERLIAHTGKPVREVFPNLELYVPGGVKFDPYLELFTELLRGTGAALREVYPASEAFVAVQDQGYGEGLRLNDDIEIYFEFVPVEELDAPSPTRHGVGEIEPGVNYAVVVTTPAGLWSYVLGDTVRFIERDPPRLLVTGRTSYMISAFGEHLIGEEIETAVTYAARSIGAQVSDFSVGAIYPKNSSELGGHLYIIEFVSSPPGAEGAKKFVEALDEKLAELNDDYRAHRAGGFGLKAPAIKVAPKGTFERWMKARGKFGGQHKVPRVINDQELFSNLQAAVAAS